MNSNYRSSAVRRWWIYHRHHVYAITIGAAILACLIASYIGG